MQYYIDFNSLGAERKRLVKAVAAYLDEEPRYQGAPSFDYEIGRFTVDRTGTVYFDTNTKRDLVTGLIEALTDQGFVAHVSNLDFDGTDTEENTEPAPTAEAPEENATQPEQAADVANPEDEPHYGLTVMVPADTLPADAMTRLRSILDSKRRLICKALGVESLPVEVTDDLVKFPWFEGRVTPEECSAYTNFIGALCEMARNALRVTAKDKDVDNEKYAFRCFLLRLGFIGADCKADRKILLKKLSGSAAFPTKEAADAFNAAQKAKRDAAKEAAAE